MKAIRGRGVAYVMVLLLPFLLVPAAKAANLWDGGGDDSNWNSATNWDNDSVPTFPVALTFGSTNRLASTNDLTGVTVNGITFAAGAGAFTLGGNPITLGGNISIAIGGSVTNDQTINFPITLNASRILSSAPVGGNYAANKGILVLNGVISSSGPYGLTSGGANYVQLNGANTYTGDTVMASDSFSIGNANAFGYGKLIVGANPGLGQIWIQSAGNLTVTNKVEVRTGRFITANYWVGGKAPGNLTLSGNVLLNQNPGNDFYCQRDLTLSGIVSGGNLNGLRLASGKIILQGVNTFTNHVRTTNAGGSVFNINSDAALGHTNNIFMATYNTTLQTAAGTSFSLSPSRSIDISSTNIVTFDVPSGSSLTIPGQIKNTGSFVKSSAGTLTLSGPVSNGGGITLNAGTVAITGPVSNGSNITVNAGTVAIAGNVSSGGGITLNAGTLALSGVNTYSNSTTIKGGVLNISSDAALSSANTPLIFTTAATLQAGAPNVSLGVDRVVNLTNAGTYTATFDVPTNFTMTVAGTIKGNVLTNSALSKTGAGTLVLSGGSGGTQLGGMYTAGGKLSIQGGVWSVAPLLQADGAGFYVSGGATYEQTGGTNYLPIYSHICNYPSGSTLTSTGMLSGGTLSGMELMVGRRSSGVLTISGNALLDLYSLKLGESTNYTTIVNLDGGVIACTHIASRATNSVQTTSILNLNGGTVRAKGVAGGLIGGYGSGTISYLTTVNVKSGGAIIDSQSYSVTIPQVLGHDPALGATLDGGLTKRGTGVLTLTTTNTYTGVTSVEAGKLKLGVANTLSASVSVLVASNAVFDVDGKAQTLAGLGGSGLVTNNSLLTVTFGIAPGGTNAIGQLTLASAPAALGGVFLADVATNGVCDRLYVQGDLDLSGLVLSVANAESLDKAQRYVVAKYKGALTGPFNSAVLPQRWNVKYDEAAREVYLHYDFGTLLLLH